MFIPLPCGPILSSRPMVPSRLVPYLLSFPSVMLWRHTDSEHVVCFVVMARALPWNYWNFLRSHFAGALTRESLSDHDTYVGDFRRLAEVESVEESSRGVLIQSMSFS